MEYSRGGVVCANCGHSIQLPSDMCQDEHELVLACLSCGHVYEYKLPEHPVDSRESRHPDPGGLVMRFIKCECTDSKCRFPVQVHAVLTAEVEAEAELASRCASWIFHDVICPFGHPISRK
jgi:hypothetical protein